MAHELLISLGRQIGDHLWQSTIFAAGIGILALTLRRHQARVRYRLWLAASLKFWLPFSLLSTIGLHIGSWIAPAVPAPRIALVVDQIATPLAPLSHAIPAAAPAPLQLGMLALLSMLVLWGVGCAAVLVHSLRRWRRVRAIVRCAAPLRTGRAAELWNGEAPGIELVSSDSVLEPGVFGIFRPVLYLPAGIAESLSTKELEAILTHELCHVRRRDNLTAAVHQAVQALFWFHPLVWWLSTRLIEERERACDEHVVQSGIEPRVYAEGILQVCRQCLRSPAVWVAGVTGSNLRKRIEEIMTHRIAKRLSAGRTLLLAGVGLLALMGPVIAGLLSGPRLRAQPSSVEIVAAPSGPKFEVVSIKPVALTNGGPPAHNGIKIDGGRVDIGYWNIHQLIVRAYGLPSYQLSCAGCAVNQRFDIAATFPTGATRDQLPEMLQWLLTDRFGLAAHVEARELPGFALVVGKRGAKMKPAEPDPDAPAEPVPSNRLERAGRVLDGLFSYDGSEFGMSANWTAHDVLHVEAKRMPMEALAQIVADRLSAPVIDRTGLKGAYRLAFDLPLPGAPTAGPELPPGLTPVDPVGAMLATVEQLGLKLERQKAPIQVLVVDRVNRVPSEN